MKYLKTNLKKILSNLVSLPGHERNAFVIKAESNLNFSQIAEEITEEWQLAKELAKDDEFEDLDLATEYYREVFLKERESEVKSEIQKLDIILTGLAFVYFFVAEGFYQLAMGLFVSGILVGIRLIISARLKSNLISYKKELEILEKARYLIEFDSSKK